MEFLQFKTREKSLLTGSGVEECFRFKDFPIHSFEKGKYEDDPRCDMIFDIGKEDGFVQLRRIVPPSILYKDSHMNAIGSIWQGMREKVAETIKRFAPMEVLELGGSTGLLNREYVKCGGKASWTIIEPNPKPVEGCTAQYIIGFFPEAIKQNRKFDLITHTHVLEHVENIHEFLNDITKFMCVGGHMVFAIPDMDYLFEHLELSIIHFEHTFYLKSENVAYLLHKYGFHNIKRSNYGNGHSIIIEAEYTGEKVSSQCISFYKENKKLLKNWSKKYSDQVKEWNEFITKSTEPVYLFGAHISSQLLQGFGLNLEAIAGILDNDPYKWGKRVAGIKYITSNPKILMKTNKCYVIVPPTPYRGEIINGLKKINSEIECI